MTLRITHRRWPSTVRALTPPVALSMAASVAGLWLFRRAVPVAVLEPSHDAVGNYLQTLGSIYAVLLAFVVFVVWQQFNDARAAVDAEASEVMDLARVSAGVCAEVGEDVIARLRAYVDDVLTREWPAMARADLAVMEAVTAHLDAIWDALRAMEPAGARDQAHYAESLTRFNDLADARARRVTASLTRLPTALRILLYLGAAVLVGSMYLFAVRSFVMHATMTAAMAGAISHILYVVEDLDDAFDGDWQVPSEPMRRAARYLASSSACAPRGAGPLDVAHVPTRS